MDIRVPEVGESVREALLAKWFKTNGDVVVKDEPICELETDKITLDINADAAGVLAILVGEGATIPVGTLIGTISESAGVTQAQTATASKESGPSAPARAENGAVPSSPAARREMREQGISPDDVVGSGKGGKITLDDLLTRIQNTTRKPVEDKIPPHAEADTATPAVSNVVVAAPSSATVVQPAAVHSEEAPAYRGEREERRPMSPIRRRIAERLLAVRQQTAMLTTFNEADMSHIKILREKYRDHFQQRHGIRLGYMPFFVKACIEALKQFPAVNASIDGSDIIYHYYHDIGIAIGGERGLVVPVLRNVDDMKLYEIEQAIEGFAEKVRTNRLTIPDLEGGTFSISNGGVYGSMLSTPILNPPQSGVLGMHAIQDRAVVLDGQIVVRPMMYLALSYDHRIIDGREAVGFLKAVKEYVENPEELLLEG